MVVLFLLGVAGGLSRPVEKTVRGRESKASTRPIEEIIGGIPFSGGIFYNYLIVKT